MQNEMFSPYPAAVDEVRPWPGPARARRASRNIPRRAGASLSRARAQFTLAQEAGSETFALHRDTWISKRDLQARVAL